MDAERQGDFLVVRDLDDTAMEAAIVNRRGESVAVPDDFDDLLPLVAAPARRRP